MYKIKLSPYAKIFYVEWLLDKKSGRYNMTMDQKIYGDFDPARLRNALIRYVSDHVILNSHVQNENEEYYWLKNDQIHELEYTENPCTNSELLNYIRKDFDLSCGPLYRFRLIRLSDMEYRFIVVFHHIVIDGSSVDQGLFEVLSHYYNQENYVLHHSLEEQIELINIFTSTVSNKLKRNEVAHKQFWRRQLASSEGIDLKFLKSNENINTDFSKEASLIGETRFSFTQAELTHVNQLKRKYRITPYIYGQCIFALLVYRHTNQKKIVLNYPVAIKEGVEFIYGAQVNTNLIPYEFNQNITVNDLFEQSRRFFNSLKEENINQAYYPITNIFQDSQEGNKRLLDVSFIQTNFKDKTFQFNGVTKIEVLDEFNTDLISPLLYTDWASCLIFEQELRNDQLNYRVRYDKGLINVKLLHNFVSNYKKLFLTVLDDLLNGNERKPIPNYEILSSDQYHQIIHEWNKTKKAFPHQKTIHQLFEEQVLKTPQHIAVIFNDTEFTYQQINQQANQLASYIKERWHIASDDLIALYLERSQHMLIAILAVLKAGGAYVPLDIHYSDARIIYILEDTKAKLVITDQINKKSLINLLKSNAENTAIFTNIRCIDDKNLQEELTSYTTGNLKPSSNSNNLAYVIYTSGTTGQPKGVMIEHKGVVNRIKWMNDTCPLTEKDRVIQKTPYVFDVSVWELFWANWYGACIVFAKPEGHKDPDYLIEAINRYQITVIHFIPSMLNIFEEVLLGYTQSSLLPSLRYLFCSGEVLNLEIVQRVHQVLPKVEIYNLYGPTEASVDVLYFHCTYQHPINAVYIGKPIDNTAVYILDNNLSPLPSGAVGELYLSGVGLARGYLNLPDLTTEKFIPNPFQTQTERLSNDNAFLYKTGDKARWLVNGNIAYIGRTDQQVKVRGYRIELGEIEAVLNKYPKIKQSAVLMKGSANKNALPDNNYLVGYYVLASSHDQQDAKEYALSWQELYQETYKNLSIKNTDSDFIGWNDSYSGASIPKEQMEAWLADVISKIKCLNPVNVLELGSGSGLILFNLIDACQQYYATDFSTKAIDYLQKKVELNELKNKVTLFAARADNVPYNEITAPVDTVIINSVIQYFPDVNYLEQVIHNLINNSYSRLSAIFIGDIRNYDLLDVFHYSVLRYKNGAVTKREIELHKLRDKELLLSPSYFLNLAKSIPSVDYVELLAKEVNFSNELSKFRYDLILHLKTEKKCDVYQSICYTQFKLKSDIDQYLHNKQNAECIFVKYPNKNIHADYIVYQAWVNTNKEIDLPVQQLLNMSEIRKLAHNYHFKAIFYLDAYDCTYLNVVFCKINSTIQHFKVVYDAQSTKKDFNNPCEIAKSLNSFASQAIKHYLEQKLPSYMVPDVLIRMDEFPLTINGKLDKDALPERVIVVTEDYVAPTNELERRVCNICAEILGLPKSQIGINHDFFKLGGNSLLAIRLTIKLQHNLKIEVADVFKLRTPKKIAEFSPFIKENLRKKLDKIKLGYANKSHALVIDRLPSNDVDLQNKHKQYLQQAQHVQFKKQYKNIRCVLLTGATGYLGCNLLYQLLVETTYKIYLPIRASSDEIAYDRLRKKFYFYFDIDLRKYVDRIRIFNADLEYSHFNISHQQYQELIDNVDSIIHAAALVKHYGNYDEFYRANVLATINLLELSKLTTSKDFHYMSTVGVLLHGYIENKTYYIFDENDDADILLGRDNVYVQTKYEGEKAVREYRQYGVASNIYRLGNLSMHSINYCNQENSEENAFFICIKTILNMGLVTQEIANVEVSPVDQSALAIVKMFDQVNLANSNHHLFNPHLCNLIELFASDKKWNVKEVGMAEFINCILEKLNKEIDNKQIELFMLHQSWLQQNENVRIAEIKVAQDKTIAILAQLGFYWPTITKEMFSGLLGGDAKFWEGSRFEAKSKSTAGSALPGPFRHSLLEKI